MQPSHPAAADVAVVGAGPAGSWAAYRLAKAGARVTVFDASHPREKPCGGGVTGRALGVVREVLPDLGLRSVIVSGMRFSAAAPRNGSVPLSTEVALPTHGLSPETGVVVASRAELDRALLQAAVRAGARLVAERVVDVAATASNVEIRTSADRYRADWLLGADGANSFVRRRLSRPFARSQLSIGTGFFVHGPTSSAMEIACFADPPGYLWSFPRPDHLAVGICAQADAGWTAVALRERAREWIDRCGIASGARLESYSWPIPSLAADDLARERPAGTRWMLLGDAAGLVDPLTREGIYFALVSAEWAAEALGGDPGGAPARYEERLREEVVPELRRAAEAKAGFFRPAFTHLMVHALRESDKIRDVMADLVCGRQPYRGLRRRLLGTRELGLALRLGGQFLTSRMMRSTPWL